MRKLAVLSRSVSDRFLAFRWVIFMKKLNWGALSVVAACLIMIAVTIYTLINVPSQRPSLNESNSPGSATLSDLTKRTFAQSLVTKIDKAYIDKLYAKQDNYQKYLLSARYTARHPKNWLLDVLVNPSSKQIYFDFSSPAALQAHIIVLPYGGWEIPIERLASEFALQNLAGIPGFISSEPVSERFYNTASMRVFQQTSEIIRGVEPSEYTINIACVRTQKQQETYIVMLSAPTNKFTQALSVYTRFLTTMRPTAGLKVANPNGTGMPAIEPKGTPSYHPHQVAAPGTPGGHPVKPGEVDKNSGKVHTTKHSGRANTPQRSDAKPNPTYNYSKGNQTINIKNTPTK